MKRRGTAITALNDGELWFLLANTWFMISRLLELELSQFSITLEQSTILKTLHDKGGFTTARELEVITLRQQHSVSIIINRMVRLGLVSKTKRKGEKKYIISLTAKGEKVLDTLTSNTLDSTFSSLKNRERQHLSDCLHVLYTRARNLLIINNQPLFLQLLSTRRKTDKASRSKSDSKEFSNQQLWSLLSSTNFTISRLRELELEPLGLSMMQSLVLKILNDNSGTMTPRYLQDITMRQHHSVSTLLTRMVRMGLVRRIKGKEGNRHTIAFTRKGKSLFEQMTMYGIQMTISTLASEQKIQLIQCLTILRSRAKSLLEKIS